MEKVKVTKEQAEIIEDLSKRPSWGKSQMLKFHARSKWDNFKVLNQLDVDELARALYIGYEVEPEFKAGDWVAFKDGSNFNGYHKSKIEQITSVRASDAFYNDDCCVTGIDKLRHATPEEIKQEKERRWWAKHGREVWQIMSGDILHYEFSNKVSVVKNFKDGCVYFQDNEQDLVDELKNHYKVICFAENRLDLNA